METAWLTRDGVHEPPVLLPIGSPTPAAKPAAPAKVTDGGFAVYGRSDAVARALRTEVAAQRQRMAEKWVGGGLPDKPKYTLEVSHSSNADGRGISPDVEVKQYSETRLVDVNVTSKDGVKTVKKTVVATVAAPASIRLRGELESALEYDLPAALVRAVFVEKFEQDAPTWAAQGLGLVETPRSEQREADTRVRKLAADGRLVRLAVFFTSSDWKPDETRDQGFSVIRFLLARQPRPRQYRAVVEFLRAGVLDGWDKAAKDVYGFAGVDDLEAAWIAWLKTPASTADLPPAPRKASPPAPSPLIPPISLTGADVASQPAKP